jgi:hypothetical protein
VREGKKGKKKRRTWEKTEEELWGDKGGAVGRQRVLIPTCLT